MARVRGFASQSFVLFSLKMVVYIYNRSQLWKSSFNVL